MAARPDCSTLPIRIGIADDHGITRSSLAALLNAQDDMCVVGKASSGKAVLGLLRSTLVDVLVLDLVMPGGGLETLPRIKAISAAKVVILTGCAYEHYALKSLAAGAATFLTKGCEISEILRAIRTVASGHSFVSPELADLLAERLVDRSMAPHEQLTSREFQVLLRVARGMRSSVIGSELFLSPKTVATYTSQVRHKMGLHTNAELTRYAVTRGLLD